MEKQKPRILIVDDNARNIQVVGNILIQDNIDIAYATNGQKALELAAAQPFDLVLLDIMMPGMDGYAVCQQLRSDPNNTETPVIFLTARNDPSSILLGFSAGANDYVTKPFNSAELRARVQTHLELFKKKTELRNLNQHLEKLVIDRTSKLEAAMRQLSMLEKSKSEFLSIISHELRGPLSGIIGLTQLLKSGTHDSEHTRQLEMLSSIAQRLARFAEMALLITSLRANNGRMETMPSLAYIPIEMAANEIQSLLAEKQINLDLQIPNKETLLQMDSEMVRRCLIILIENAALNLPSGSVITLSLETNPNNTSISVITRDHLIPDELLHAINDYMLTGQIITSQSSGLSLAAVKLMLDAHGGQMLVRNLGNDGCVTLQFSTDIFNP